MQRRRVRCVFLFRVVLTKAGACVFIGVFFFTLYPYCPIWSPVSALCPACPRIQVEDLQKPGTVVNTLPYTEFKEDTGSWSDAAAEQEALKEAVIESVWASLVKDTAEWLRGGV